MGPDFECFLLTWIRQWMLNCVYVLQISILRPCYWYLLCPTRSLPPYPGSRFPWGWWINDPSSHTTKFFPSPTVTVYHDILKSLCPWLFTCNLNRRFFSNLQNYFAKTTTPLPFGPTERKFLHDVIIFETVLSLTSFFNWDQFPLPY